MLKIALIEDDSHLAQTIIEFLSSKNYVIEHFENGDLFIERLKISHFDLIILDLMMHTIDGFDILKYLNEANSKIPIVVASGVNSISSLENAFALGAIDFIKKPLHLRELLARIKRFDILSHRFYFNSFLYFDNTKQLLIKDEKEIKLTLKQREILSLFVKYPNETITYEFLQIAVWSGRTDIKLNTISTYIRDINPVIFPSKIKNIPKVGYTLNNIQSKDKANKYN